jgi:predicted Zn-dependent protease
VNRFDISNPKHRQLGEALLRVAESANPDLANSLEVGVVPSQDINAVSMGDGRFVLWEGLGALPQSAVDAILAHEVAHDLLLHSRRAADLSEFTAFWTDMMGTVAQADFATSDVITGWGQGAVMPRYSRSQEREADTFAITLLGDLGYEKAGGVFADALQLLLDRYGDTGGAFGDSHPATSERISAARARQTVRSERRSR